jgi:RNA polymerase sigma-70 factor (ECF subfamily)
VCIECPAGLARDLDAGFATLVAHHQDLVFGVARRVSANGADAEDLAQETFVRAYRALRGYDAARIQALHLRGWLSRICLNLGRNRARDRAAATAGTGSPAPLEEAAELRDLEAAQPEQVADRREAQLRWSRLLTAVPPRYRTAVAMRHVDGLSYPELAAALGRPVNTVKSDVHRGVALLRAAYEHDEATVRNHRPPLRVQEVTR